MGELIRNYDWSKTSLGSPDEWPQSLRTSVSILINSQFPMFVWWGTEMISIYNDAYRSIAGEKHPAALGKSGPKVWAEIWDVVGPLAHEVMTAGASTWAEDQLLYINRHGYVEENYFTFSYSPVLNESGTVGGVFCACTETTEKVQAHKKIEESEERFRNLADESPMFVFIIEPDPLAPVSYWNKTWLYYTGQSFEEAQGGAWDGIIHPDDVPVVMNIYAPAFEKKKPYFIPAIRVKRHDDEYRWHAFKGNPRYLPDGAFNGFVGVGFDIHEQKIAEDAIRESESRFRLLADSMPQFVWAGDRHGNLNYFNQAVYNYSGLTEEQVQKDGWLQIVHPEEREENIKHWMHSMQTGEDFIFHHRFRNKEGNYR